jgi:hypothetical protein
MTPRYTDPRYTDPRFPQGDGIGGPWAWIAGIAAVVLIPLLVLLFVGINQGTNPASDKPLATTESAPNSGTKPSSTTGFGGSSPQPISPPARSGQ